LSLEEARKLAYIAAAGNALKYGEARVNPVLGKILGAMPQLRSRAKEVRRLVEEVVAEVNQLPKEELIKIAGRVKEKKRAKEERRWPELVNYSKYDRVVTRVAPEPNGYPTLGHAKGLLIPFIYARLYKGVFQLRFEDTNPRVERLEYYDAIRSEFAELLEATSEELGIGPPKWDVEIIESNDLPVFYKLCRKLLEEGKAYVCTCSQEKVRANRKLGLECECRRRGVEENLELWELMHTTLREGEAHVRLKTDMKHKNPTMRDPGIFRIIEAEHPIQGTKYRVYPTYDFSISVEDSLTGVTHAFRSKEFEPHVEVQKTIIRYLGLREFEMIQFGRITVEGVPLSKRYIRPLIKSGILWGWDDPRIPTLRGLKRRGVSFRALARFIFEMGPSKVDAIVNMESIYALNRKILDPIAERYMFVPDPVKLVVEGSELPEDAELPKHPSKPSLGTRRVKLWPKSGRLEVYVPSSDLKSLRAGERIRLWSLATIKLTSVMPDMAKGELAEHQLGVPIVQWTPVEGCVPMEVVYPDSIFSYRVLSGFGDPGIRELKEGSIVQLLRVGFARIDSHGRVTRGILAHR